jgi:hypothetical protein
MAYPHMGHQQAQYYHLAVSNLTVQTSVSVVSVSHPRRHGQTRCQFNPLNAELNPICHLLAFLGGATIVVVSRLRVKSILLHLDVQT